LAWTVADRITASQKGKSQQNKENTTKTPDNHQVQPPVIIDEWLYDSMPAAPARAALPQRGKLPIQIAASVVDFKVNYLKSSTIFFW